jgi:hypothetical protein
LELGEGKIFRFSNNGCSGAERKNLTVQIILQPILFKSDRLLGGGNLPAGLSAS